MQEKSGNQCRTPGSKQLVEPVPPSPRLKWLRSLGKGEGGLGGGDPGGGNCETYLAFPTEPPSRTRRSQGQKSSGMAPQSSSGSGMCLTSGESWPFRGGRPTLLCMAPTPPPPTKEP